MEKNYNKEIGERIKLLREAKGEYQKETAEAITRMGEKLSEGQLGLYEIGVRKLPPNITKALATHFKTTTDYILGIEKSSNKENDLHQAASSDIDLAKLAKLDKNKKEMVEKTANDMINMFYDEFGNKE